MSTYAQSVELLDYAPVAIARVRHGTRQADLTFHMVEGRVDESRLPLRDIKALLSGQDLKPMTTSLLVILDDVNTQIATEMRHDPAHRRRLGHGLAALR